MATEETTINSSSYEMHMMSPRKSHRLLVEVVKMIGPSLGPVADMFFSGSKPAADVMDQKLTPEFFTKAAQALFSSLDERILDKVIDALAEKTMVDGKLLSNKGVLDLHYMGKLDEMYKWLAWGMTVQWGKSLSALVNVMPTQISQKENPKAGQSVSLTV
jgi:hypothetical protein